MGGPIQTASDRFSCPSKQHHKHIWPTLVGSKDIPTTAIPLCNLQTLSSKKKKKLLLFRQRGRRRSSFRLLIEAVNYFLRCIVNKVNNLPLENDQN
jgi:hypothetical protein